MCKLNPHGLKTKKKTTGMKLDEQSKVQTRKAIAGRVKKKTTGQKWEFNAIIRVFPQSTSTPVEKAPHST